MSSRATQQLSLVGLPGSGKTSFLAALWYMVDQSAIPCGLKLEKLVGERKYLNQIRDAWMGYRPVARTSIATEKVVSMVLRNEKLKTATTLHLPDLSGEGFQEQWTKRHLTRKYESQLASSAGALFFVHSTKIVKPLRIDEVEDGSALVNNALPPGTPVQHFTGKPNTWNAEKSPTQVQLIELLQVIGTRKTFKAPFRLAVVVSAFDLAAGSGLSPAELVERELPMFKQFLDANGHMFEGNYYGISAQGGEYHSPEIADDMILDPQSLSQKLSANHDPVCQWMTTEMAASLKQALAAAGDAAAQKHALADALDGFLGRGDLWDATRFAAVQLRDETRYQLDTFLLKASKESNEVMAMNRLLLEEVFTTELSREWKNEAGHKGLVGRHPSQRVSVIGSQVGNERDITEPIQWLMR